MTNQMTSQMISAQYGSARSRALRGQIWSMLTGRPNSLLSLGEVDATCEIGARRHAGLRTVPISQIRGSEGRSRDFDREFYPLQGHTAERWRGIAKAREEGKSLPPVDLVKVGEVYFVLDGHHRISVARTVGQLDIEAKVTEWQVDGPLPWETDEDRQETVVSRLLRQISESGSWVRDRAVMGVRNLVPA